MAYPTMRDDRVFIDFDPKFTRSELHNFITCFPR